MSTSPGLRLHILGAFTLFALAVLAPSDATAAICVDVSRSVPSPTGSCAPGGDGRWESPFPTLAAALAAAGPGAEVWVARGTYAEDGLVVPSGVHVIGGFVGTEALASMADPAANPTTIRPATPATAETVALVLSPDVALRGLRVTSGDPTRGIAVLGECFAAAETANYSFVANDFFGSAEGVRFVDCDSNSTARLEMSRNAVYDNIKGIRFYDSWPGRPIPTVSSDSDSFFRNLDVGLELRSEYCCGSGQTVNISGGLFVRNGNGITSRYRTTLTLSNTVITQSSNYGALLGGGIDARVQLYATNVSAFGNALDGFRVGTEGAGPLSIDRSTIARNQGHGVAFSMSNPEPRMNVTRSRFAENHGSGLIMGNAFQIGPFNVQSSVFQRNGIGVSFVPPYYVPTGTIGGSESLRNAFIDNVNLCIDSHFDEPSQLLPAEWNHFQSDDAATIDACITGNVDFTPWYWPSSGLQIDGEPRQVLASVRFSSDPALPAVPHDRPGLGSRVSVTVLADTWSAATDVGSFGGSLRWDPRALQLVSWNPTSDFPGLLCSTEESEDGILRCSATAVDGVARPAELFCATFDVVGSSRWPSPMDVEFTSLYSSGNATVPFEDLLPFTLAEDTYLSAAPAAKFGDVLANGRVDSGDALVTLSREVSIAIPQESSLRIEEHLGDANGDGETNSTDANIMLAYEIHLPTPRPSGESNVVQAACGGALGAAPAKAAAPGPGAPTVRAWLVLNRGTASPGQPVEVEIWLNSAEPALLGNYTAELRWPADRYQIADVRDGGKQRLARPRSNKTLDPRSVLPFTAADPRGEMLGALRLIRVTLSPLAAGARPAEDLSLRFRALASASPDFTDWRKALTIGRPVVISGAH